MTFSFENDDVQLFFIEIPECEITTTLENNELLINLKKFGFNNYCLLSDFTEKNDVYVNEIIHKANFNLNKEDSGLFRNKLKKYKNENNFQQIFNSHLTPAD